MKQKLVYEVRQTKVKPEEERYSGTISGRSARQSVRSVDRGRLEALTDAPATVEGIDKFIEDNDHGNPNEPAGDVCCCAKSPVLARARHARCNWIWVLCYPKEKISAHSASIFGSTITHCNNMNTALKSKKV